jgi:hypothetical protein
MATVRYGAKDARAMRLKQAASELVWSASAKPLRQERARHPGLADLAADLA